MPRNALPFRSIVVASRNDPLASYDRIATFARSWASTLVDLGEVGHLNPASGFGEWPHAEALINELDAAASHCWTASGGEASGGEPVSWRRIRTATSVP